MLFFGFFFFSLNGNFKYTQKQRELCNESSHCHHLSPVMIIVLPCLFYLFLLCLFLSEVFKSNSQMSCQFTPTYLSKTLEISCISTVLSSSELQKHFVILSFSCTITFLSDQKQYYIKTCLNQNTILETLWVENLVKRLPA